MKKNIFQIVLAVFIISYLFYEIQEKYYQSEIKLLQFGKSYIKDFIIVGKNREKFVLKGDYLEDKKDTVKIENFVLNYIREKEVLNIKSKVAKYLKKVNVLTLEKNVNILGKNLFIDTDTLYILLKDKKAFNSSDVVIKMKNITTSGKNIVVDLKNETLQLEAVKSKIRGI